MGDTPLEAHEAFDRRYMISVSGIGSGPRAVFVDTVV